MVHIDVRGVDQMDLWDDLPPSRWLKSIGVVVATPAQVALSGSHCKVPGSTGGQLRMPSVLRQLITSSFKVLPRDMVRQWHGS